MCKPKMFEDKPILCPSSAPHVPTFVSYQVLLMGLPDHFWVCTHEWPPFVKYEMLNGSQHPGLF